MLLMLWWRICSVSPAILLSLHCAIIIPSAACDISNFKEVMLPKCCCKAPSLFEGSMWIRKHMGGRDRALHC